MFVKIENSKSIKKYLKENFSPQLASLHCLLTIYKLISMLLEKTIDKPFLKWKQKNIIKKLSSANLY